MKHKGCPPWNDARLFALAAVLMTACTTDGALMDGLIRPAGDYLPGHRVRDLSDSQTFFTVPWDSLGGGRQLLQTPDTLSHGRRLQQAPAESEADVLDDATIGIFSAYHDPVLAEVRIFTEVHPRGVCPKFHRCFFPDASTDELIAPADIYIPFGSDIDAWKPDQVDCYITCTLSEAQAAGSPPKQVKILSDENEVLASTVLESLVSAKGQKGVGMCLGPVYSYIPQFVDWLTYWSAMGVGGIHAYSPVLDRKKGGSGFYRPTFLMHHYLLDWTLYKPLPHSHYFGQRPLYNDCIYRNRHMYDFIFMWDADEFIHFPQRFPDSLHSWLSASIPANTSGASLQIAEYNVECRNIMKRPMNVPLTAKSNFSELFQTYTGYSVFQVDNKPAPLANCTDQGWCLVKSLVRPLSILAYNVHHPQAVYEGWVEETVHIKPTDAFYKHLRCVWKDETAAS